MTDIIWTAVHVDLKSDVLKVGPYQTREEAINVFEGIRIGARMVLDMGEDEIEGFPLPDERGDVWAVLYDPLPEGSGFLPEILAHWEAVCRRGTAVLADCTCERACYKCMKHFRNQQFHSHYDRYRAIQLLEELEVGLITENEIPPLVTLPKVGPSDEDLVDVADSPAEEEFLTILREQNYPLPDEAQYSVDLGGKDFTVADYAYVDERVLIFIDGLSEDLHGDPGQAQKDRLKRAKARMQGYQIVAIPAQALHDKVMISSFLDELSLYLQTKGAN